MTDEKKIEEMANTCAMYHSCALCPYNPEDISRFIGKKWKGGCPNYDRQLVYAMGKGYRKITEGAVVLTREEFDLYKTMLNGYRHLEHKYDVLKDRYRLCEDANETIKQHAVTIRKETAREIIDEIKAFVYNNDNLMERLDIIAKQYGVEIKE